MPLDCYLLAATLAPAQQYQISTLAGSGPADTPGMAMGCRRRRRNSIFLCAWPSITRAISISRTSTITSIRQVANTGIIQTFAGTGTEGYGGDNGPAVTTSTTASNGTVTANISSAEIGLVYGLATDASRNVYFADPINRRVRRVTAGGCCSPLSPATARPQSQARRLSGPATSAELNLPYGLAVDSSNNVYISDIGTYTIFKVDGQKGTITTFAGNGSPRSSGDGGPATVPAIVPYAIAFDPAGNLYLSDTLNQNIRKILANGNIQTVVSGVSAVSIAVDAAGNIYYPNPLNSTVVKILPGGSQVSYRGQRNGRLFG